MAAILASEIDASRFSLLVLCFAPTWSPWFRRMTGWCKSHKLQTGTADVCHRPLRRTWSEIRQRLHFLGFILETYLSATHLDTNILLLNQCPHSEFRHLWLLGLNTRTLSISCLTPPSNNVPVQEQERMGACQLEEMPVI